MMEPAETIRDAIAQVQRLRVHSGTQPDLDQAIAEVKRFQSERFARTYADLTVAGEYKAAALFFLHELYGDRDFAERDAQFQRIAGAIQRFLPSAAVGTAVALAQLHALTERLDHAMGVAWRETPDTLAKNAAARYVHAWRSVGSKNERLEQLSLIQQIGYDLEHLTAIRGLRTMLRMMRSAASAAGLASLQQFLETGFDTFAELRKTTGGASGFLRTVQKREAAWIDLLFDTDFDVCVAALTD